MISKKLYHIVPDVSDSSNFDCKDAKGMYYPSPFDCQSYYQCMDSNGPPMKLSCPNDLQFNPIMQKCDDPSKVATVKPECVKSFTSNNNVVSKLSKVNSKFPYLYINTMINLYRYNTNSR